MRLSENAPLSDDHLRASTHKTYTDCYRMRGFLGGDWGYSLDTNEVNGRALTGAEHRPSLEQDQRRLAIYFLGWESIEVCLNSSFG